MSLVGERTLVVSTGISCQTSGQLRAQIPLLNRLLNDELLFTTLPFDWMIAPIASATKIVSSGNFFPEDRSEIEMAYRPYWKRHGAFYWHSFKTPEGVYSIDDAYEATRAKFTSMQTKLLRWKNKERVIIVGSNTQNNIPEMALQSGLPIDPRVSIKALRELQIAWESLLGRPCEMWFVSYSDLIVDDYLAGEVEIATIERDETDWMGNDKKWASALSKIVIPDMFFSNTSPNS
jgi:hypothetical protein